LVISVQSADAAGGGDRVQQLEADGRKSDCRHDEFADAAIGKVVEQHFRLAGVLVFRLFQDGVPPNANTRECLTLGLVKDVEAFGLKQKFGRVRAYDPEKRALIIEVGLPPTPRGEWKDAADFDRLLTAYTQRRFVSQVAEKIGKDHPAEQLAGLQFRGQLAKDLFRDFKQIAATNERLKALLDGPVEKRAVSNQIGDLGTPDVSVVVAPRRTR